MAGGKLSPRQKMVNLMYLVFIAMLAMNMSKEVLSAFGNLKEKVVTSTTKNNELNQLRYEDMATKAAEQPQNSNGLSFQVKGEETNLKISRV